MTIYINIIIIYKTVLYRAGEAFFGRAHQAAVVRAGKKARVRAGMSRGSTLPLYYFAGESSMDRPRNI
jgi:hypothetical protein